MIRLAEITDEPAVLAATQSAPATGPLLEMHWRLWTGNRHMPHRFFLSGASVLKLSGRRALLCGRPENDEELAGFLAFNRVDRITVLDWVPPGWPVIEESLVLVRPPAPAPPFAPPPGLDTGPTVDEVLAVLESTSGRMAPEGVREGFWVDAHIRRNHGVADVWGIREGGQLVSTAGAWAITPRAAYIACVETRPKARGKGYATALVKGLAAAHAGHSVSLMCEAANNGFYTRLGFRVTKHRALVCENPEEHRKQEH